MQQMANTILLRLPVEADKLYFEWQDYAFNSIHLKFNL